MQGGAKKAGHAMAWMQERKVEKEEKPTQSQEPLAQDGPPPLPFIDGAGYIKITGIPFFATKDDILEFLDTFKPGSIEHIHYEKSSLETGVLGGTGEAFVMLESKQKAKEAAANKNGKTMVIDTIEVKYQTYGQVLYGEEYVEPEPQRVQQVNPGGAAMAGTAQSIMQPPAAIGQPLIQPVAGGQPYGQPMGQPMNQPPGQPVGQPVVQDWGKPVMSVNFDAQAPPQGLLAQAPPQGFGSSLKLGIQSAVDNAIGKIKTGQDFGMPKAPNEVRSGDWICPVCNDYQFARNDHCRKCGFQKVASGDVSGESSLVAGGSFKELPADHMPKAVPPRKRSRSRDKSTAAANTITLNRPNQYTTQDGEEQWRMPKPAKEDLVARVKLWQRSSEEGKQQWIEWVDQNGWDGKRDPNYYDGPFLEGFLNAALSKNRVVGAAQRQAAPPPKVDPVKEQLVQEIKRRQRGSEAFKERWGEYCFQYAGGHKDPQRHDISFMQAFLQQEKQHMAARQGTQTRGPFAKG